MGTASIHEGVRRMRFSSLLERTEAKELTQEEASEMLGINVRTFQRWAERYEAEGDEGLVDRRMGRPSAKRAPASEIKRMLGLYRDQVCRLHGEALPRAATEASWLCAGLHGDEARVARGRSGAEGAQTIGAPQEASPAPRSGNAAASGRLAARLAGGSSGDGPDLVRRWMTRRARSTRCSWSMRRGRRRRSGLCAR